MHSCSSGRYGHRWLVAYASLYPVAAALLRTRGGHGATQDKTGRGVPAMPAATRIVLRPYRSHHAARVLAPALEGPWKAVGDSLSRISLSGVFPPARPQCLSVSLWRTQSIKMTH